MIVAPFSGKFSQSDVLVGDEVDAGKVIGKVSNRQESVDLLSDHGGIVIEFMVEDGDPVAPGQPIARLHPHGQGAH
jgi:[acyl-carrier-protein] S-malonyltransferase